MSDPIVEEVRRYRMEHTRKFGGDLFRICEDLHRLQRRAHQVRIRRGTLTGNRKKHTPVTLEARSPRLSERGD